MSIVASIRIVKGFVYRGVNRETSNRYHLYTGTPADDGHWTTLADAIVAAEKAIYRPYGSGGASITQAIGYAAGSEIPVFNKVYSVDGTGSFASSLAVAGDTAALVRYSTGSRSSKNHPIYGFSYYHTMPAQSTGTTADTLNTACATALGTYASHWVTGFSDGTNTYRRCTPAGHVALGYLVEPLLTHRDLPR